ncbi:MAG: DUF1846 domain-containing protein [Erysipelotrichaceae bacterium]|nr:DUF1846 domain-containing protein [Erysipelotrichaceae bacterium]
MNKIAFDSTKYLELQTEKILERIRKFNHKLYLEFGGKIFDDFHASRVLPGYDPNNKIHMLTKLADYVEIIIVISANSIEQNKTRSDLGISYDQDVYRLLDAFRELNLYVGSVVISQFANQPSAVAYKKQLEKQGIKVYLHYPIDGYPTKVDFVVSEDGLGKNEYIETTKQLVVVTAPGPGSGKMATCISQMYHDHKHGIQSGYAKFETFPIWNLPLKHPVNLAYEAATADLNDVNMIDPFHLEAYQQLAVNYNRDVEVFPVLNRIFERIQEESPYKSPTDMGVNMVGFCITDEDAAIQASKNEIIRRYYHALVSYKQGDLEMDSIQKIELLMEQASTNVNERKVALAARQKAEDTGSPALAIELNDGTIVTGKTSSLFGPSAAVILNALKALGGINPELQLISKRVVEPIQSLKIDCLGNHNPRLHSDELLIALSIAATTNPVAELAMKQLSKLKGAEGHSTVILPLEDANIFRKLGVNMTCDAQYHHKKLYHKR